VLIVHMCESDLWKMSKTGAAAAVVVVVIEIMKKFFPAVIDSLDEISSRCLLEIYFGARR
jgi:hypothetical protein